MKSRFSYRSSWATAETLESDDSWISDTGISSMNDDNDEEQHVVEIEGLELLDREESTNFRSHGYIHIGPVDSIELARKRLPRSIQTRYRRELRKRCANDDDEDERLPSLETIEMSASVSDSSEEEESSLISCDPVDSLILTRRRFAVAAKRAPCPTHQLPKREGRDRLYLGRPDPHKKKTLAECHSSKALMCPPIPRRRWWTNRKPMSLVRHNSTGGTALMRHPSTSHHVAIMRHHSTGGGAPRAAWLQ